MFTPSQLDQVFEVFEYKRWSWSYTRTLMLSNVQDANSHMWMQNQTLFIRQRWQGGGKTAFIAHLIKVAAALLQFAKNKLSSNTIIMGVVCEKVDDLAEYHEAADQDARRNQLRFRELIKVGFAILENRDSQGLIEP